MLHVRLDVVEGGRTETIPASDVCIFCIATSNAETASLRWLARSRRRTLIWLLASAMAALGCTDAFSAPRHQRVPPHESKGVEAANHKHGSTAETKRSEQQVPRHGNKGVEAEHQKHGSTADTKLTEQPRHGNKGVEAEHQKHGSTAEMPRHKNKEDEAKEHKHSSTAETKRLEHAVGPRILLASHRSVAENAALLPPDLKAAKQAIELARQHKSTDAIALATSASDPVARKLVEWVLLRDSDSAAGFDRFDAFIRDSTDWPSIPQLRRRAEAKLWQERRDAATVRRFIGEEPTSTAGRLALARVLIGEGDRGGAERQVRAVWHTAELSAELEAAVLNTFHDAITPADDAARMDRRIGAKDFGAAMRAAKRLGPYAETIVKACAAAEANSPKAETLLAAVSEDGRGDLGYELCRLHWLLGRDDVAAATKLAIESSREGLEHQDVDEWWRERRTLARRLIDVGDPRTAYRIVRGAATPSNPYYRAEYHFMAGWIALRFLNDPTAALGHFTHVDEGSKDPIVLARAAYWRGRTAEAASQFEDMRAQYKIAAAYPTAYYGQLARARLGLDGLALLPPPPPVDGARNDVLHAAEILYAIGEYDLVLSFISDLAEASTNIATLTKLGDLAARYNDAQAMLALGKETLARGLATERYAFPQIGVPPYSPIAPQIDRCVVYSIVRTESAFDQRDKSPANAVGLMQVTPEAGRDTAKRFGIAYDWKRLLSDPVYNTQMGAAEISALFKEYTGSYIMTFAGYNAGRGRVRQWVAQHGDPRDPKIDAVDWVERIPLAETRNYVQRVMENVQVYGARFGASIATNEPNLHRAANVASPLGPAWVDATP
jgi:soluble lytic murein transglycosylase